VTGRAFLLRVELNDVSGEIVRAAITVHSALGPGLLESAYRTCLCHELFKRGLRSDVEVVLPLKYDGVTIDVGYRLDLLVEDAVIVELVYRLLNGVKRMVV